MLNTLKSLRQKFVTLCRTCRCLCLSNELYFLYCMLLQKSLYSAFSECILLSCTWCSAKIGSKAEFFFWCRSGGLLTHAVWMQKPVVVADTGCVKCLNKYLYLKKLISLPQANINYKVYLLLKQTNKQKLCLGKKLALSQMALYALAVSLSPHFCDIMQIWLLDRSLLWSSPQCGLSRSV